MRYLANATLLSFLMLFLTACSGKAPAVISLTASPSTISTGDSTTLTAVYEGGTGSIDNSVGSISSGQSVTVTPLVTTTYTLNIIDGAGDKAQASVTVVVGDLPTVTSFVSSATTIAMGSSANLTAVFAGGTGVIDNGVNSVTSGTAVSVSPTATTTYTITVTNAANTAVTSTVTVNVVQLDALSLSVGALDQIFQSNQASYTATVGFLTSKIKIQASTVDTGAVIKVNNVAVDANNLSQFIALAPGTNAISISVTKNAITTTYSLNITRQTLANLAEQAILHASDTQVSDVFGYSVSVSGDTLVVGAHYEDGGAGDLIRSAGAAYVFTRSGTTWSQQQILHASDKQADDYFGISVSVSGDTLVVGAAYEDGGAGDPVRNAGAAYVFTRSGTTWSEQQKLLASDKQADDFFGYSVSVSGDTLVVGAYFENGGGAIDTGAAYVFTRSGTTWSEQQILHASDAQATDLFGFSVSVSGDTLVVGAPLENGGGAINTGAAYVFTRFGATWTQQKILHASDKQADNWFGSSVSVSGDTLAVGAPYENGGAGAAYIYK